MIMRDDGLIDCLLGRLSISEAGILISITKSRCLAAQILGQWVHVRFHPYPYSSRTFVARIALHDGMQKLVLKSQQNPLSQRCNRHQPFQANVMSLTHSNYLPE
jgi:hypothetical protein